MIPDLPGLARGNALPDQAGFVRRFARCRLGSPVNGG